MLNILILAILTLMISAIVMLVASFFSKKSLYDREKSSPFECGFDPMTSSRIPFSIRFFLITIIFLIFDVEIALILPTILIMKNSNLLIWFYSICIFIFILLVGLYHEWNQGALSWTN